MDHQTRKCLDTTTLNIEIKGYKKYLRRDVKRIWITYTRKFKIKNATHSLLEKNIMPIYRISKRI